MERDNLINLLIGNSEVLKKYIDFQAPISESPEEFHIFTMIHIISSILRRQAFMIQGTTTYYPNLYTLIAAISSQLKKSVAVENFKYWMNKLNLGKHVIGHITTIEGLGNVFANEERDETVFSFYDEYGSLLSNSTKSFGIGLIEDLNELYNCGPFRKEYKKAPIHIKEPYLNIIGASQLDSLSRYVTEGTVLSGFFPRHIIVYSKHMKDHIPFRPYPDPEKEMELEGILGSIKQKIEDNIQPMEYRLSEAAKATFITWSNKIHQISISQDNRISTFLGRTDALAFKLSMILQSAYERTEDPLIKNGIMKHATNMVNWIITSYKNLVINELQFTEHGKKMQKIRELISKRKRMTRSDMKNFTKFEYREINEICQSLSEEKFISIEEGPRGGFVYKLTEIE